MLGRVLALAFATMVIVPAGARAEDTLRVGYLKIPPLISFLNAERGGHFEKEGLKTELVTLNSGPAILSGVVSGSIDIGMTATTPIAIARGQGQPIKVIGSTDFELASEPRNWIVATEASGIKSPADLKGKTIAVVGPYTAADLTVRDFLMANGLTRDDVNYVAMPFPQMQAAMESGNVDAAMVGDPFYTAIMHSTKMKAVEIASGMVADLDKIKQFPLGAWFASDAWISQHTDTAAAFLRAIMASNRELAGDRSKVDAILVADFGMPAEVAAKTPFPINTESLTAEPPDYQVLIDALARTKLIDKPVAVGDLVKTVAY
jgi:NitT/TauT family transport system substrate-binding protein